MSVLTGGTNFSQGGIFGQSNCAHVIKDSQVAGKYLDYLTALHGDPENACLLTLIEELAPLPQMPPQKGSSAIYSPRSSLESLHWYAELAMTARQRLLMTFASRMHDLFKEVFRTSQAPFRLALFEKATPPMKKGSSQRLAEEQKIKALRGMPENTFAVGSLVATNKIDGWMKETLSGLNSNVAYVHNKFMIIGPMSENPVVVAGSANFSAASTNQNDENMVIVSGNNRVAEGQVLQTCTEH